MKQSQWAKQQVALGESARPAKVKTTPPPTTEDQPPAVARPRGRPKTRLSTLSELAEYLHVAHSTVYRLIDTKQLPHLRIGSVLRFDLPTVLRWAQDFTARGDRLSWVDDHPELNRAE